MGSKFQGKRVLVTGAGAGIGRETTIRLAEMGAQVIALSRTQSTLDSLKSEYPSITTVCVDVSNWDETRKAVKNILPIHLLVNNAGVARTSSVLEASPEDFDYMFNINVKSVLNITQIVAKDLIERKLQGSVVNISSQAGQRALPDHIIYSGSKGALDAFTRSMALELAPKGIRVNAVSPTVTMTPMGKRVWTEGERTDRMLARIPQGKFAEVKDVVNAIVYLLSEESDMINGHMLPVDGGFLAA